MGEEELYGYIFLRRGREELCVCVYVCVCWGGAWVKNKQGNQRGKCPQNWDLRSRQVQSESRVDHHGDGEPKGCSREIVKEVLQQ